MFWGQALIIVSCLLLFSHLLIKMVRRFGVKVEFKFLLFPLWLFGIGFIMRLSGQRPVIDLGFFFTDISGLFVSVLFATFLFLGQLKYWKK